MSFLISCVNVFPGDLKLMGQKSLFFDLWTPQSSQLLLHAALTVINIEVQIDKSIYHTAKKSNSKALKQYEKTFFCVSSCPKLLQNKFLCMDFLSRVYLHKFMLDKNPVQMFLI